MIGEDMMRAAVFEGAKKIVIHDDYPRPNAGPDEAVLNVHYCAICGSDVTNFKKVIYQVPIVMGHELSGEIVEVGSNVEGFKVGDRATGVTVYDTSGRYAEMRSIGVIDDGAFAEYVKVPKKYLFKVAESISMEECTMTESFAVVMRALKRARITKGQKIAIVGGGSIGLITLQVLLAEWDPEYVIVIEPHEFLREKAKEMGATDAFPPIMVKINRFYRKHGMPNFIFECAGTEKSLQSTFDLIERGGTVCVESICKGHVPLPLFMLNSREISLVGTMSHEREDILDAIALMESKRVDPGKLISKIIPLDEIQEAFEAFIAPGEREFIKIVVKMP